MKGDQSGSVVCYRAGLAVAAIFWDFIAPFVPGMWALSCLLTGFPLNEFSSDFGSCICSIRVFFCSFY